VIFSHTSTKRGGKTVPFAENTNVWLLSLKVSLLVKVVTDLSLQLENHVKVVEKSVLFFLSMKVENFAQLVEVLFGCQTQSFLRFVLHAEYRNRLLQEP
jgi:hypothetical protein